MSRPSTITLTTAVLIDLAFFVLKVWASVAFLQFIGALS